MHHVHHGLCYMVNLFYIRSYRRLIIINKELIVCL